MSLLELNNINRRLDEQDENLRRIERKIDAILGRAPVAEAPAPTADVPAAPVASEQPAEGETTPGPESGPGNTQTVGVTTIGSGE